MPQKYKPIPFLLAVILLSIACSFSAGNSKSEPATVEPPASDIEKETKEAVSIKPSDKPSKTAVPVNKTTETDIPAPFEIDEALYVNPSGAFQLNPPLGWTVDEDDYGGSSWISPDEIGYMYVAVTNTGLSLDEISLKSFIDGYEQNTFFPYENYTQTGIDEQYDSGYVWVYKTLNYEGVSQYVATYYQIYGQGVLNADYWVNLDEADAYSLVYDKIHQSIQIDSSYIPDLPIYHWVSTFSDRNNLYKISIPRPWVHTTEEDTNLYIDTFLSPDGYGLIENMAYDDGSTITKGDAGKIALYLLNNYYTSGAGDIKVTGDKVQSDGSERLDWTSRSGGYHGQSFFETRGTTFLMFSTIYSEGYEFYREPFEMIIQSYTIE